MQRSGSRIELLAWVGRVGVADPAQLAAGFPGSLPGAVGALCRAGLLWGADRLLLATADGLRVAGLGHLGPARLQAPHHVAHRLGCGWLGLELEAEHGPGAVRYERELWAGSTPWAMPEVRGGAIGRHRADLAVEADGRRIAVELELTRKSAGRLEAILAAYAAAPGLDGVRYVTPDPAVAASVTAAARRAGARALVEVRHWDPPPGWPG